MSDYSTQKVPDLKKLLSERGLVVSGNKADLVARLQEDDKKKAADKPAEDEIDWDEDEKPTTAPAAAAVAAGGLGSVANPTTVPNQKVDLDPSTTTDLKVTKADDGASAEKTTEAPQAPAPEVKKQDFAIGIAQTDAEKEIAKRRARAEKFGMPVDDEAKKLARAAKFGVDSAATVVRGLDEALPERKDRKRGREERQGGRGDGRAAKRQTPDRRTEAPKAAKKSSSILDDPREAAKARERAKKFATGAA